jgi:hypothetical protein
MKERTAAIMAVLAEGVTGTGNIQTVVHRRGKILIMCIQYSYLICTVYKKLPQSKETPISHKVHLFTNIIIFRTMYERRFIATKCKF